MIRCTYDAIHSRKVNLSEQYFFDIDFSILGQRELEYNAYKQNIRLEYIQIPSLIYYFKRKSFLKKLLQKKIYQTQWFSERYEEQAIKNIKHELSEMPFKILPIVSFGKLNFFSSRIDFKENKRTLELKIDDIIADLSLPLSSSEAADGWGLESKQAIKLYFEELKHALQEGKALPSLDVCRGMDHWGVVRGPILEKAAQISNELRLRTFR